MKKNVTKLILMSLISIFSLPSLASGVNRKGKWYASYGWNRADYENSTIHFHGKGHEFTLYDVSASDAQTPVNVENMSGRYLSFSNFTIPQYNWRFGYFFTQNFALSLGWDHMKYVVNQNQTVKMSGYIDASMSPTHQKSESSGTINKTITPDFLQYEHTDGFNTITLEGEYLHSVYSPSKGFDVSVLFGLGGGVVYPKTNVTLTGHARNDEWHLAGVVANAKLGVEFTGWDNFFFRLAVKRGYADMYDVLTTSENDKASQNIVYSEYLGMFGYRF